MRAARFFGLLLPAALLATGCSASVPHVAGSAAPVVGGPASSTPTSATPVTSGSAPSAEVTPSGTGSPAKPAGQVYLGPTGWGTLKLGMTAKEATATGLIGPWGAFAGDTTPHCQRSDLRGGRGAVVLSAENGVVAITVHGVRTPQGIGKGTSRAAMLKAYPDWWPVSESRTAVNGRGYAEVPGNRKAKYRIEVANEKVTSLSLESTNQNCYE